MITLTPFIKSFMVDFTPVADLDLLGYKTHAVPSEDLINGDFTPSESNLVNHGPDTSFTVKVEQGGEYAVKVAAYDAFGEDVLNYSSIYTVVVATTDPLDQVPPPAPVWGTCLTGIDNSSAQDNIYISLDWLLTEPEDFSNYILAYKKSTDANWTETVTTAKTHRLNNLIAGVTYQFQIKAVDRWNNSSIFVSYNSGNGLVAAKDMIAPSVPSGLSAVSAFKNVFVKWTANSESDFKEYILQVDDNSGFTSPEIFHCSTNSFTYQSAAGVTSYFKVSAVDYSGNASVYSGTVSAITASIVATDIDNFAVDASKIYSAIPVIKEASSSVWTANTPANGISWAAHTVVYKSKIFTVNAGSTTSVYVNANLSGVAGAISYTGSSTQASTADNFTMAKNTLGKLEVVWQSQSNMVIGSAYIMDGAIGNAKIGELTADKITSGYLDCNAVTLNNLTFSDTGGTISWLTATDSTALGKTTYIGSTGIYSGKINVSNLTAGIFAGGGIGFSTGATVNLDGTNARIAVNDGTRDRVWVGKLPALDGQGDTQYGIDIKDKNNLPVFRVDNTTGAVIQNATVGNLTVTGTGGILCGSGASSFKVWESAAGNMSMYIGSATPLAANSINYDSTTGKVSINADIVMSASSTISWSASGIPSNLKSLNGTEPILNSAVLTALQTTPSTIIGSNYVYTGYVKADKIDVSTAKITSAQIGSITADQIDVTNSKITTLQLGDNAVTIPKVWTYSSASQITNGTFTLITGYLTVPTAGAGQPLLITANLTWMNGVSSSLKFTQFYLSYDNAICHGLAEVCTNSTWNVGVAGTVTTTTVIENVTVGTHTIKVHMYVDTDVYIQPWQITTFAQLMMR